MSIEHGIDLPRPAAAPSRRGFRFDNRFLAPVLITCILVAGQYTFGFLESYTKTALAILTSMAVELVLGRAFTGKWPHLASAYITGISVGILIRSPEIWPYAVCSAISITSKYAIRVRGHHIWNPSNFGICVMLVLAYETVASLSVQWGNNLWAMLVVWVLGSIIIWRLDRLHICATYVASFVALAVVRSWVTGHPYLAEVAPITGPMYQLFVFFMITDPKTTVRGRGWQCVVAVAIAVAETAFRLTEHVHAPYYALFVVGPTAYLVQLWWTSRKVAARSVPEPA